MGDYKKISNKEFFSILRENGGLFARTAKAIESQFGISYTRQSVRDRALRYPKILEDIEEENIDIAEEGLLTLMKDGIDSIKIKAIELYLRTKGKGRGYIERQDLNISNLPEIIVIKPGEGIKKRKGKK